MANINNQIVVIGTGATTAVGLDAPATAAAVRAGVAGFQEHPFMIDQNGEPYILAMVPGIDAATRGIERYLELSMPAVNEALLPIVQYSKIQQAVVALIGLAEKRPGIPKDLGEYIKATLQALNHESYLLDDVRCAHKGHSSGIMTMEAASQLLLSRETDFCLIGGVDSYIDPDGLDWIEANNQLHTETNAWGFVPGEASGFCLLCRRETAETMRIPIKAYIRSVSSALEQNRIKTETVCIGQGLTQSVATTTSALPESIKINQTFCDQNGEAYRADEYGFTLARLSEKFNDASNFVAPADCWGDVGAASGPLFIGLVTAAAEKQYSDGPISLLWTSSEAGERSSAILETIYQEGQQ